jgi:hypothetical protein
LEIGSLFGGLSCTGVLGSNLPAIPRGILGYCPAKDVVIVVDDVKEELSGRRGVAIKLVIRVRLL